MGDAFTSYVVDNDRRFRDAISRAQAATGDLRAPFGLILADFYRSEQAIFSLKGPGQYPPFKNSGEKLTKKGRRKGGATFKQFENFSPYQKMKLKKKGFDYPLLVFSGRLSASVLSKDAPGSVASIGPTQLIFGTTVSYGIYHQSDAARSKIPLRKFLFIGPEASQFATSAQMGRPERWMNILNDYVLKSVKASGVSA